MVSMHHCTTNIPIYTKNSKRKRSVCLKIVVFGEKDIIKHNTNALTKLRTDDLNKNILKLIFKTVLDNNKRIDDKNILCTMV